MVSAIDSVKLYKFNIPSRVPSQRGGQQHIFLRLGCGDRTGWGECRIPLSRAGAETYSTENALNGLYGRTITEAFRYVRTCFGHWRYCVSEMAELALIDLQGRLTGRSALDIMVLGGYMPVMAASAIPTGEHEVMLRRIEGILSSGSHIAKIRLVGDGDLDRETIELIRRNFSRERLYLIGAACESYTEEAQDSPEKLGVQLLKMYTAGLDACEDPASMTGEEWKQLRSFVEPLHLIASIPIRPARYALSRVSPDTADIFNIHPGMTGSIFDAAALAEKMKAAGKKIAVGDDGFIGPGCSEWQQLAVGMGARWIEAMEKPGYSDSYLSTLRHNPVVFAEGCCSVMAGHTGFGIDIDDRMLEFYAAQVISL